MSESASEYVDQVHLEHEERRIKYTVNMKKSLDTIQEDLYHVCNQLVYRYMGSDTKILQLSELPEGFTHVVVKGGITNRLFVCRLGSYPPLLVRLFGPHTDSVINRVAELKVAKYISKHKVGPAVFGSFSNGRLEGFIDGAVSLTPSLMLDQNISSSVAEAVAAMHCLPFKPDESKPVESVSVSSDSTLKHSLEAARQAAVSGKSRHSRSLWETITDWLRLAQDARSYFLDKPDKLALYDSLNLAAVSREFAELRPLLETLNEPKVFCHNDLLSGNILHVPNTSPAVVTIIDYEYGSINYRAFDIANHFCECCGFDCDWTQFPDVEHQRAFIRTYLRAVAKNTQQMLLKQQVEGVCASPSSPCCVEGDLNLNIIDPTLEAQVEVLRRRVLGFVLTSHMFWATWAVVMSTNNAINFDYLGYSALRLKGYYFMKHRSLLAIAPVLQSKVAHSVLRSTVWNNLVHATTDRTSVHVDGNTIPLTPITPSTSPSLLTSIGTGAAIIGWGLSGRDLHAPTVASSLGMYIRGCLLRKNDRSESEYGVLSAETSGSIDKINNYFNLVGLHIDQQELLRTSADTNQPCHVTSYYSDEPNTVLVEEQAVYDATVTHYGVGWDLEKIVPMNFTSQAQLSAFLDSVATHDVLDSNEGISLVVAPQPHNSAFDTVLYSNLSTQFQIPKSKIWSSIEEVVTDSSVDVVIIGTPGDTHFDIAVQVLKAKKHVVIDKPFTTSLEQHDQLVALAEENKVVLCCFQNRRWDSDYLTVKSIIANNTVGDVKTVNSAFLTAKVSSKAWKLTNDTNGGGNLWDLGVHTIDQVVALMKPSAPTHIACQRELLPELNNFTKYAKVRLTFDNGVVFNTRVGVLPQSEKEETSVARFEVVGSNGVYSQYYLDQQEEFLLKKLPLSSTIEDISRYGHIVDSEGHNITVPLIPGRWSSFYEQLLRYISFTNNVNVDKDKYCNIPVPLEDTRLVTKLVLTAIAGNNDNNDVSLGDN